MRPRSFRGDFFRAATTQVVFAPKIGPIRQLTDSLRSDGRQGSSPLRGAPLVPRSASLTASSLRLRAIYGELALPSLQRTKRGDCHVGGKLVET